MKVLRLPEAARGVRELNAGGGDAAAAAAALLWLRLRALLIRPVCRR